MDYSKMSDFEINLQVNRALGMKHYPNEEKQIVEVFGDVVIFDPCNNAADAWPIIADRKICLAFDVFAELQDGGAWVASPAYGWERERVRHDNPLRAAMIVYLQLQEAK